MFFIYLSFMIQDKCVRNMSEFKKSHKIYEGFLYFWLRSDLGSAVDTVSEQCYSDCGDTASEYLAEMKQRSPGAQRKERKRNEGKGLFYP